MTTPNIEELRLLAQTLEFSDAARCSIQRAADLLQSQAERIKVIERGSEMRRIELHDVMLESDQLRAQLAAIAATEPVLIVEKEPDYWSGGHFHEGSKSHIKPTKVWCLPVGTKLFTHPMPAQDVTELVDALEMIVSTHQGHCEHHVGVSKHSYNLADIAEEALSKYKGAK